MPYVRIMSCLPYISDKITPQEIINNFVYLKNSIDFVGIRKVLFMHIAVFNILFVFGLIV